MTEVRELTPDDAPALTALYEEYEWWEDRDVEGVRTALAETEVAIGVEEGDAESECDLVAAARVLTDYAYYATVFDVIVAADRRGEGLGETLLDAVVDHPDLQSVPGLSLLCREGLVPFYESVGFEVYGRDVEVPEGGTEELVRMTYAHDES
ncbi:GNAT family N-acetyltransferase [Halorussus sp. AFM4]|uniref:GNAT family N-acetyltransferase n=1 Tax=Halorussus sp. AFM4 TaxID=3421651 RepID=UPI003EC05CF5